MKRILFFTTIIFMSVLAGCSKKSGLTPDEFADKMTEVSVNPKVYLIDVRTKDEYDGGHLISAINYDINDSDFLQNFNESAKEENVYLLYCRTDNRSRRAYNRLKDAGFKNVYYLIGGYTRWTQEGRPTV